MSGHTAPTLLRSALLALIVGAVAASQAIAADMKIIVPASPGGGWDQLGRAVQQSLQANKLAGRIQVNNVPGAGGTVGLATLSNSNKGDPNALLVSGRGMVGAIFINKSPISLTTITPVARLTGEYEVLVVAPALSCRRWPIWSQCTKRIPARCRGRGGWRAVSTCSPQP